MSATLFDDEPTSAAVISDDGRYRYTLYRRWSTGPAAVFCMLNGSTADWSLNDPTVRRCIGFARAWGCGGLWVINMYGLRSTAPEILWTVEDPVGPENDRHIDETLQLARREGWPVIAAWGVHAKPERVAQVLRRWPDVWQCLGVTKNGSPKHPLYLPGSAERRRWPVAA